MNSILYSQHRFPTLQNRVFNSKFEAVNCETGDIELVQNEETGLIFNQKFDPNLVKYDSSYNNEQSLSPRFQKHLKLVAEIIINFMGKENLVEIGCGKGYFLELLLREGVSVTGFDPTYEGSNDKIIKAYFDDKVKFAADGLILRHVLEHIPNPIDFLLKIRESNSGIGKIYIEVPCFDWILSRNTWFDIFYEHVNYFRAVDFQAMFGSSAVIKKTFDGQYLSVVADLKNLCRPKKSKDDNVQLLPSFFHGADRHSVARGNKPICIWGGASKGVIFSMFCEQISARRVVAVVDINPSKQGKYLPITGHKIISPFEFLDKFPSEIDICVMNSNYLDEIKDMTGNKYSYIGLDQ
jgi:hypothetical protein